ncbi:MAG: TlyA family RNA methyltransferase [Thermoanaerobacterales bacterium]|nr:TlyA family RNA methyltransferase [Thermoanaerobacterales bacterium]
MERRRLDVYLVQKGFFPSRERARSAVMAGHVYVSGRCVDKPGTPVPPDAVVEVRGTDRPYVSRGGLKLEGAITAFGIDLRGKVVLDAGASTGGFTDCALQHGARRVYAVDVGYGQLDWSLRTDPRVTVLERANIRYLDSEALDESPDFVTVDLSFISLGKVLPNIDRLVAADAEAMLLVKPQFEAGPEKVGKKGVVRDPAVHAEVLGRVLDTVRGLGWQVRGVAFSPIRGPEGNIEYLVYATKRHDPEREWRGTVGAVVEKAHAALGSGK